MGSQNRGIGLIVVGTSQGGFDALKTILSPLPRDFGVPIAVVRHQRPDAGDYIIHALGQSLQLKAGFAGDGEAPLPGKVYIAPPDRHLEIGKGGCFSISGGAPVHYSRPAIDPLFTSAAACHGPGLAAVVLTGANHDGAEGAKAVKAKGGLVIVQDPDSAEAREMPLAAQAFADHVIWLDQIGPFLWSHTKGR